MPGGCISLLCADTDSPPIRSDPYAFKAQYASTQQQQQIQPAAQRLAVPRHTAAIPANSSSTATTTPSREMASAAAATSDVTRQQQQLDAATSAFMQPPLPSGAPRHSNPAPPIIPSGEAMPPPTLPRPYQAPAAAMDGSTPASPTDDSSARALANNQNNNDARQPSAVPFMNSLANQVAASEGNTRRIPPAGAPPPPAIRATATPIVDQAPPARPAPTEDALPRMPANWSRGKLIGAGAFGQVYLGRDNMTGKMFAVKQVALTKDQHFRGQVADHTKALEAEVKMLRQLRHKHIVQYIGTERTDDTLNIFLEYVAGGSIASNIEKFGPLEETLVKIYTKQILKGLEYLHERRIMHRDIKGANVLVDIDGVVKLADFGASKKIEELASVGSVNNKLMSITGTPYYMAPEIIKQEGHGRPADIWSMGCCVIEMATGKPPWNTHNPVAAMYYCASAGEQPKLPKDEAMPYGPWSPEARDFLAQCFNRIPSSRPNATTLLMHPWLAGVVVPSARPAPQHVPAARYVPSPIKEEEVAAAAQPLFPQAAARPARKQLQLAEAGAEEGDARQLTLVDRPAAGFAGEAGPSGAAAGAAGPSKRLMGNDTLNAAVDAELALLDGMSSFNPNMLTMAFNPMTEPSWMPNGPQAQLFGPGQSFLAQAEAVLLQDKSSGLSLSRLGGGGAGSGPGTSGEPQQPEPLPAAAAAASTRQQHEEEEADSFVVVRAELPRQPAGPGGQGAAGGGGRGKALVPPLPRLSELMASGLAQAPQQEQALGLAGVPVQEERHARWRDELLGELHSKRQEQRASVTQQF